eukprot:TRINITY_DN10641_c0_g1_i1.p1 TRINITY_DN10641_c0_g1~~TRINITY_DN10641_c0_g1_i1.p1  ORF type:complete len:645 (-),score=128.44 TRINITY_DN10641_c0_g1_i1:86-2020(-)
MPRCRLRGVRGVGDISLGRDEQRTMAAAAPVAVVHRRVSPAFALAETARMKPRVFTRLPSVIALVLSFATVQQVVHGSVDMGQQTWVCHCIYDSNKWMHLITNLVSATKGRSIHHTVTGGAPTSQFKQLVAIAEARQCDANVTTFADTDIEFDLMRLDMVGGSAVLDGGAKMEMYHFCIPGQVLLSLLCVHKFLLHGEVGPAMRWVQAMQNLLSFVEPCMDHETPFPVRVADMKVWVDRWISKPIPQVNGRQDIPALLASTAFEGPIALRPEVNRPMSFCLPLKDPGCFPTPNTNTFEACVSCCDEEKWGEGGNAQCWAGPYTFERCCHKVPVKALPVDVSNQTDICTNLKVVNTQLAKDLAHEEKRAKDNWRLADEHKRTIEQLEKQLASTREALNDAQHKVQKQSVDLDDLRTQLEASRSAADEECRHRLDESVTVVEGLKKDLGSCHDAAAAAAKAAKEDRRKVGANLEQCQKEMSSAVSLAKSQAAEAVQAADKTAREMVKADLEKHVASAAAAIAAAAKVTEERKHLAKELEKCREDTIVTSKAAAATLEKEKQSAKEAAIATLEKERKLADETSPSAPRSESLTALREELAAASSTAAHLAVGLADCKGKLPSPSKESLTLTDIAGATVRAMLLTLSP